jgi:hypothetical protein
MVDAPLVSLASATVPGSMAGIQMMPWHCDGLRFDC